MEAEIVIELCDRWHKTPDEILAMDAGALQLLAVYGLGHPKTEVEP